MAIDPSKTTLSNGHGNHADGRVKWLLGVLGLLWIGGMALRALRSQRFETAESSHSYAAFDDANRLGGAFIHHAKPLPHPTRGHESRDANVKWIFGIVLFLFVSGMGIHGIMAWYLSALKKEPSTTDAWRPVEAGAQKPSVHPPPPVLQVSAPLDLQAFQAREQAELHSYGWVNRTAGIVRIPIERAMDAVLQEGLPTRHGTNEGQAGASSQQLIQRRLERREPEIRP